MSDYNIFDDCDNAVKTDMGENPICKASVMSDRCKRISAKAKEKVTDGLETMATGAEEIRQASLSVIAEVEAQEQIIADLTELAEGRAKDRDAANARIVELEMERDALKKKCAELEEYSLKQLAEKENTPWERLKKWLGEN